VVPVRVAPLVAVRVLLAAPAVVPRQVGRQLVADRIVMTVRGVLPVPLATVGAFLAALVATIATIDRLAVLVPPEQVVQRVRPAPVARRAAIDSMLEVPPIVHPGPTVAHARTAPAARCAVHHPEATAASAANGLPGATGRIARRAARARVATDLTGRAAIVRRGIGTTATFGRHVGAAVSVSIEPTGATGRHVAAAGPVVEHPEVHRAPVRVVGQVVRCDRAAMPRGRPVRVAS
jgi:hypothetical protein